MEQLEQKIRRSSRLKDTSSFRQLLAYAAMVRDEDEVFAYMQENKIGINQPEFWAAKLTMLKNKCQYSEFIKVLKQLNKKHELKKHPKYWLISQIENQLERYLQRLLRKKSKVKRSAKQYEMLNYKNVEKQTRKFGKIQVYVDPDCRMQYRLEDLVQFVTKRLSQQLQIQKNYYEKQIGSRPLSFLGKAKDKINKLSQQVFGFKQKAQRQSNIRRTGGRISIVGRKSNKQDIQTVQTPDFKKKSVSKQSKHKRKNNKQNLNLLDSIQILKYARKKSFSKNSSRRNQDKQINPEFDTPERSSSIRKQKIRKPSDKQQSIFSEPDLDNCHSSLFSFADQCQKISSSEHKPNNRYSSYQNRYVKHKNKKNQQVINNQSNKDFAFIQFQQTQTQVPIDKCPKNSKQSMDLQNVIKQIQMQKYQSQTFSQIDSNKQNNILFGEEDSQNINMHGFQNIPNTQQLSHKQRKKFETLKKDKQASIKNSLKYKKQTKYETNSQIDQSSQIIYKQLLFYLDEQKNIENQQQIVERLSISEKNKKKRISRISEQRSYSFSQTRPRSRSNTNT